MKLAGTSEPVVFYSTPLHDAKNWIASTHIARYRSSTNELLTSFQKVIRLDPVLLIMWTVLTLPPARNNMVSI